ncbi:MAG TPA: hypothetical protein DD661_10280 [Gammaproteobacteria bacterium]|jgi:ubiquinone/menaquinone biosynthesis C-methylase UbiE|nr:hypothetical protein [Gammaproteobacteria bacterium]|tara:strand:+ start:12277 stop:13083 length:807 start_codon:yes stop_codon:yes gene_type:complete
MSQTETVSQYNDKFNAALQWMWGDGYLAPGGSEEVAEMLHDLSIKDADVVDVGSGLGVIAVLLAEKYGAGSVMGIDVEAHLIDQSTARAEAAGLGDRVRFKLVEPGPLPLDDESLDVVFSKDAIVHMPDKVAFYREALRVLRPGGLMVGSDWLRGDETTLTSRAQSWLDFVHLDFRMSDLESTRSAISNVGFEKVSLRDRNEWYQTEINKEISTLEGENFSKLEQLIGKDEAGYRLESSRLKKCAIDDGFLRPTHFFGYKPDASEVES